MKPLLHEVSLLIISTCFKDSYLLLNPGKDTKHTGLILLFIIQKQKNKKPLSRRVFTRDFNSFEILDLHFGGWSITYNCFHEITQGETHCWCFFIVSILTKMKFLSHREPSPHLNFCAPFFKDDIFKLLPIFLPVLIFANAGVWVFCVDLFLQMTEILQKICQKTSNHILILYFTCILLMQNFMHVKNL